MLQMEEATIHLSLAQSSIHSIKTKRCEPDRIESTIALKFIHCLKHGIMRAAKILIRPDKVFLEMSGQIFDSKLVTILKLWPAPRMAHQRSG